MAGPSEYRMRGPGGGGRANMRAKAERPKNMKNTILRLLGIYVDKMLIVALIASMLSTLCNLAALHDKTYN